MTDPAPARNAPADRGVLMLLAGLLALGLLLRMVDLGEGLWYDEIVTLVRYVRQPIGEIVTTYDSQNQHLLYSLLARPSVVAFGESAAALRLPAALFGVVSLWTLYLFGRRVTTVRETLCAVAILAVSYHHVWFSQNARGYTMLLAGTLASTALLLPLLEDAAPRSRRLAIGYAVVTALTIYTHVTALFVVASQGLVWLSLLVAGRLAPAARRATTLAFLLAAVLTLLLYAPVLSQVFETATRPTMAGTDVEWKNPLWLLGEMMRGLSQGVPGGWPVLIVGIVITVAGLVSYGRNAPTAATLMVLPVAITAAAMLATAHNLWPRLFFFAAGFAVLIVVRGVFAIAGQLWPARGTLVATAGCALAALASLTTVPGAWHPKQDHLGARDWVAANARPGDRVVTVDMTRLPFGAWLGTGWTEADSLPVLEQLESGAGRVLVLYAFPARLRAVQPALLARLERDYREAARFPGTVGGGTIVVMTRE